MTISENTPITIGVISFIVVIAFYIATIAADNANNTKEIVALKEQKKQDDQFQREVINRLGRIEAQLENNRSPG